MPNLSAFTPCGMLAFSSKPSHLETIYKSMWSGLGGNYAQGGTQDARIYAQARGLARVRYTLQRAGNQALPTKITDLLPRKESEYGLVPGSQDDLVARRRALATRTLLPAGAMLSSLTTALQSLLGSDFVALTPTPTTAAVQYPATIGSAMQNFQDPSISRKLLVLTTPITSIGYHSFTYTLADSIGTGSLSGAGPVLTQLNVRDVVIVEPDQGSKFEKVTIVAQGLASTDVLGRPVGTASATFLKSHPNGSVLTNQPWPYWWNTTRYLLVQVTAKAALNANTRRQIHELMARLTRGVDQWAVVISNGPFVLAATQSNPVDTTKGVLNATPLTSV